MIIAAQGADDSLDFYWAQNGSPTWNPEVVPLGTADAQPAITTWSYYAWDKVAEIYGVSIISKGSGFGLSEFSAVNGRSTWFAAAVSTCDVCGLFSAGSPATAVYNNGDLNVAVLTPNQINAEMYWQAASTDPYGVIPPAGPFNQEVAGEVFS